MTDTAASDALEQFIALCDKRYPIRAGLGSSEEELTASRLNEEIDSNYRSGITAVEMCSIIEEMTTREYQIVCELLGFKHNLTRDWPAEELQKDYWGIHAIESSGLIGAPGEPFDALLVGASSTVRYKNPMSAVAWAVAHAYNILKNGPPEGLALPASDLLPPEDHWKVWVSLGGIQAMDHVSSREKPPKGNDE